MLGKKAFYNSLVLTFNSQCLQQDFGLKENFLDSDKLQSTSFFLNQASLFFWFPEGMWK